MNSTKLGSRQHRAMGIWHKPLIAASLGAVSWTGFEYALHRFVMHELWGKVWV